MEASAHGGPPLLRQINSAHVVAALRGAGPLSLSDLATRTGLSRPTVGQVVEQLHASGLLAWVEPGQDGQGHRSARSGRPARLVRFRSEAAHVVGIDIGRHKALVTVADLAGTVVAEHREDASGASSSADLLAVLRTAAREALAQAGIRRTDVASVAAGTPGLVDWPRGAVMLAPGLPGWKIELARELRRSFRCPVQVENDANLAALAERRHGLARDAHTLVFIYWGERVGAGVLIGDQLHRGAANAAGEIGFLALEEGTTAAPDQLGRGPFERMVGAEAIVEAGREAAARHGGLLAGLGPDGLGPDGLDPRGAEAVFAAAAQGDPAAVEAVHTIARRFARGLAPVLLVLDPDLVVIGAGVSRAGSALLAEIQDSVGPLTLVPPRLELSKLGDESVALGAVELALADAETRLLPAPGYPA
ncbi:MAG TPA: ROK family transcriptional regulator [Streptosporangiaceae bacterium]|jgi:predicted NBD/HSP70 family sugar kinase